MLLAKFTPATEFCPQSDSLTVGGFRAWNGLSDRHDFDRVSVTVSPMHHRSTEIDEKLRNLGERLDGGENVTDSESDFDTAERKRGLDDGADDSSVPFCRLGVRFDGSEAFRGR